MEYIKEYNTFVNEEFDIYRVLLYLLLIPTALIVFVLAIPFGLFRQLYNRFTNNWESFARNIQTTMDLVWTYSVYITDIEKRSQEHNLNLSNKEKSTIKRAKRLLYKTFGKYNITEDEVKQWCKNNLYKIAKKKDREKIDRLIDSYDVKILPIEKQKLTKKLHDIYDIARRNGDYVAVDMWEDEEEDWDEVDNLDEEGNHINNSFYMMYLDKKSPVLGKYDIDYNREIIRVAYLRITRQEFEHALQKTSSYSTQKNLMYIASMNKYDWLTIIKSEDRDVFIDIVKHNWKYIRFLYKKMYNTDLLYRRTPEDVVSALDESYEKNGVSDMFGYNHRASLVQLIMK